MTLQMLADGLIKRLERPDAIRYVALKCLCILGNHNRIQADYQLKYGLEPEPDPPLATCEKFRKLPRAPEWRPFPRCPTIFSLFRSFNNTYMMYIVLKYFFSKQIGALVGLFMELERPIHCYLMGRYILHERVAELTAALFSVAFLVWRLSQALAKPHPINLIYFLMPNDNDREWLYSCLESSPSGLQLAAGMDYHSQFSASKRFLIDTMCYKVIYSDRVVFKLRANRTREAYVKLRHRMAILTLVGGSMYLLLATVLSFAFILMHLLDQRHLRVYPDCDPQLVRLQSEGKLSTWSMTLNPYHRLTFIADLVENSVLWFESGLIVIIAPLLVYMCNHDLVLQWAPIGRKIAALERDVRRRSPVGVSVWSPCRQRSYELSAEIADFISQTEMSHTTCAQFLNASLIGSLGFCTIYTYNLQGDVDRLPLELAGVLLLVGLSFLFGFQSFIMVHYTFTSSHATLCSLMAHDNDNQVINYGALLEFFVKRRDCALMMYKFRFVPTTFLTIIGWTFSCFCYSIQQAISR